METSSSAARTVSRIMKNRLSIYLSISALALSVVSPAVAVETLEKDMTVEASPEQVVDAIMKHRTSDPEKLKVVSKNQKNAVIREKIIGSIGLANDTIVYEEHVFPNRVDYNLLEAEKLSKFNGSWLLKQEKPGQTHVTLVTHVDSPMNIPFKGKILRGEAAKQMNKRLTYVKREAERL